MYVFERVQEAVHAYDKWLNLNTCWGMWLQVLSSCVSSSGRNGYDIIAQIFILDVTRLNPGDSHLYLFALCGIPKFFHVSTSK